MNSQVLFMVIRPKKRFKLVCLDLFAMASLPADQARPVFIWGAAVDGRDRRGGVRRLLQIFIFTLKT
jgi:hypothetical protein